MLLVIEPNNHTFCIVSTNIRVGKGLTALTPCLRRGDVPSQGQALTLSLRERGLNILMTNCGWT